MVTNDFDRFLQSACDIKCLPFRQILTESIDVNHTVFDENSSTIDICIVVNSRSPVVL